MTTTNLTPRPDWATVTERGEDYLTHLHTVSRLPGVEVRLQQHTDLEQGAAITEPVSVVALFDRADPTFTDAAALDDLALALVRAAAALREAQAGQP